MNRRGFLARAIAAPWVVRSGVLMPVKPLVAAPAWAGVDLAAGDYGDVSVVSMGDTVLWVNEREVLQLRQSGWADRELVAYLNESTRQIAKILSHPLG